MGSYTEQSEEVIRHDAVLKWTVKYINTGKRNAKESTIFKPNYFNYSVC